MIAARRSRMRRHADIATGIYRPRELDKLRERVGSLILDVSVLIGLLDAADAHHQRAVDDVEAADQASIDLLTPASAFSEALVAFGRAGRQVVRLIEHGAAQAAPVSRLRGH